MLLASLVFVIVFGLFIAFFVWSRAPVLAGM
jgi:predicted signal transduction protein with EAL and GGDEF domain